MQAMDIDGTQDSVESTGSTYPAGTDSSLQ